MEEGRAERKCVHNGSFIAVIPKNLADAAVMTFAMRAALHSASAFFCGHISLRPSQRATADRENTDFLVPRSPAERGGVVSLSYVRKVS